MQDLRTAACRWLEEGRAAVVVEILEHQGSVPRETGTRMLVSASDVLGTIGGGHLELRAIADARAVIKGEGVARLQRVALGPTLGQCCGGALQLAFTPLAEACPEDWSAPLSRFTLQLYGAGHVGRAVVKLLSGIACRVQWIDERESEFPADPVPSHIERICVEPVEAEVAHAPPGAFFLVMTHSHDLDLAISHAVLKRGDFGWFGLIGSQTKRARFENRLRQRGVDAADLARMQCPIGLPGIHGKEPEIIALAVVAQLLQQAV